MKVRLVIRVEEASTRIPLLPFSYGVSALAVALMT